MIANDKDFAVWPQEGIPFPKAKDAKPLLFWDEFIPGNFYYATTDRIKDAMYHLNRNFTIRGYALYSEFLEFLNIEPTEDSTRYGWSAYKMACEGWYPWIDFYIWQKEGEDWYRIDYKYEPLPVSELEEYD